MRKRNLKELLIVAILLISTSPLYVQRQQQNVAKLKADARSLVGIIGSDKTKTQTYCQISDLSEQLIQAVQEKDRKKANALAEKIAESYKKMGPEFAALIPGVAGPRCWPADSENGEASVSFHLTGRPSFSP